MNSGHREVKPVLPNPGGQLRRRCARPAQPAQNRAFPGSYKRQVSAARPRAQQPGGRADQTQGQGPPPSLLCCLHPQTKAKRHKPPELHQSAWIPFSRLRDLGPWMPGPAPPTPSPRPAQRACPPQKRPRLRRARSASCCPGSPACPVCFRYQHALSRSAAFGWEREKPSPGETLQQTSQ